MKKRQEMRKRCQALVLAGILGAGTLGSAYTAYAAGPGETPASVGASAAGGPYTLTFFNCNFLPSVNVNV